MIKKEWYSIECEHVLVDTCVRVKRQRRRPFWWCSRTRRREREKASGSGCWFGGKYEDGIGVVGWRAEVERDCVCER